MIENAKKNWVQAINQVNQVNKNSLYLLPYWQSHVLQMTVVCMQQILRSPTMKVTSMTVIVFTETSKFTQVETIKCSKFGKTLL